MSVVRLIIVGDEVLSGEVQDRNIHFLATRLQELGTRVRHIAVIPDEDPAIVAAIQAGLAAGERMLVTGGIGPTHDDRTRPAVAAALGLPLALHPEAAERLRAGYGARLTPAELLMASLPAGARLLVGPVSGIYGFQSGPVYVFPGVPDLLRDIFDVAAPDFAAAPIHRRELQSRLKEGDFAEPLAAVQELYPDVAIGSYPARDERGWFVRLILKSTDAARLEAALGAVEALLARG